MLVEEMKKFLGATQVETRVTSGQMSNTAVFSAMMDFKNRVDRKRTPQRLGWVMNNHIVRGGHLSAQPMGAFHDYVAIDPVTEKQMVVNFPVCEDNPYKIDVEKTKVLLAQYKPEFIIFGKSMVLHKEPVAEIRKFVDEQGIKTTIMYDMAHVLGLIGDHFQKPFEEGAEIVTGSTHKTFFGAQRGVIGVNYKPEDLKWGLWETIETRTFPGSVSNHHLGTLLGQLMAAYEMNAFKDEYQKAVVENAKHFAKCLAAEGLDVAGDPAIGLHRDASGHRQGRLRARPRGRRASGGQQHRLQLPGDPRGGGFLRFRRAAYGCERNDPLRLRQGRLREAGAPDRRLRAASRKRQGRGQETPRRASGDEVLLLRQGYRRTPERLRFRDGHLITLRNT